MATQAGSSAAGTGEAPNALQTLCQLLALGTSTNASDLSSSESNLSSYEAHFHSHPSQDSRPWLAYLEVALPRSNLPLPPSHRSNEAALTAIRTLAIIRLKHAIEKYWRAARIVARPRNNGAIDVNLTPVKINDEDKAAIRSQLLDRILGESNRAIALQASVCISRIARTDYPNQWPNLFEQSLQALNQAATSVIGAGAGSGGAELERNALVMLRAAEVAKRCTKELSQVKVLAGKVRMAELAKQMLPSLLSFYPQLFAATFPTATSPEAAYQWVTSRPANVLNCLVRVSHLLFKLMTALAIADIGTLSARASNNGGEGQSNLSNDWFKSTPGFLDHVFTLRLSFLEVQASPSLDQSLARELRALGQSLTKHLSAFGKLYLGLLDKDKSRATSWPGWADIVGWYWTKTGQAPSSAKEKSRDLDEEALMPYPSTLVIHTLLLLRRSLEAWHSPGNAGRPIPSPFDTEDFAVSTADIVVDYFLPFERSALERWEGDPEQWTVEEEQAQEDFTNEVRPCAERLLIVLAQHSKQKRVGRAIWRKFIESASYDVHDLTQVVRRDAVYTALGRLRDYLPATQTEGYDEEHEKIQNDRIDVSQAFVERLLPEASQVPPAVSAGWVLIRRRVSWLLYEYSEKVSPSARDKVYRLLTLLLDAKSDLGGDIAVRLSAARTLGAFIDDIGFDAEVFQPYLSSAIKSLAELATDEELCLMDSIALSTRTLSLLIERSGPRVASLVPALTELAPALWAKESSEECKTRPAVLALVKSLLRATESLSASEPSLSARLQSIVAPLVTSCLQRNLISLLGIDALQLWHRAIRSAAAMQGDLFNLLSVALDVNSSNGGQGPLTELPDFASEVGRVVEEYALWFEPTAISSAGPGGLAREVVRVYGAPLFASWAKVLNDDPMTLYPVQSVDAIVQSMSAGDRLEATGGDFARANGGSAGLFDRPTSYAGVNLLAQHLSQSGLFDAIVRGAILLKGSTIPSSHYVCLLSRLAITLPPQVFFPLLESTLHSIRNNPANPLGGADAQSIEPSTAAQLPGVLLDLWPARFETTAAARKRKLIALGMCALLTGAATSGAGGDGASLAGQVVGKVGEWVGTWLDALAEVREKEGPEGTPGILLASAPGDEDAFGGAGLGDDDDEGWLEDTSAGSARARSLNDADLGLRVRLADAVKGALGAADANVGGGGMQVVWQGMDPMVVDLLQRELGLK